MKQSRFTSLLKSLISTAVGFGISLIAQWAILPVLIGHPVSIEANLSFAAVMTALSIARGYVLERVFEMMGWRVRMSPFVHAVIAERLRQIEQEGWSIDHDNDHQDGELARAGACYAKYAGNPTHASMGSPAEWPWSRGWWKPADFRRNLVKGCALIVAEGEKFDRNRKMVRRSF